ncbi:DUF87 domain-containing protein [Clostridium algidicarnis]|uniref:ATP-binding protein n=1 Tax=Clostridium algidicarnis TaxID=37659 RepID=UPI001C0B64FE|nr:ATP-binding protein [Clostridium algidicarnis]MBU3206972.1 DUF87 domain-containing protein [Clostridium algidicarnis]
MESIFTFEENDKIGTINYVDTAQVIIEIDNELIMPKICIGNLIAIETSKKYEYIIAIIDKVTRKQEEKFLLDDEDECAADFNGSSDFIKANIVGIYKAVFGEKKNVFKRGAGTFPQVNSSCYYILGVNLQNFMNILNTCDKTACSLKIGRYLMETDTEAILDGDKFFQRHAAILGSTGSGKSWCVANILEKASVLKYSNLIVFDMHGEYASLCEGENRIAEKFKIAGPSDTLKNDEGILFLPYWLLNREEMLSMILDRSDNNAPNQASRFTLHIRELKEETLKAESKTVIQKTFTVDSPIPFKMEKLIERLIVDDTTKGVGAGGKPVKGEWEGKLTRFISRLSAKIEDKTYGFMFKPNDKTNDYGWLAKQMCNILGYIDGKKGIKIIDFSEVPSDILPVVTGTLARVLYNVQFWMKAEKRTPFTMVCDEAHLYLPVKDDADAVQKQALYNFERIAKEGRKYGISLLVVSQRPSDVSKTILSQCNNFVVLRLTNDRDKGVIKNLLPDSLKGTIETLSLLDVGEAIVIGDAILLPSRIILDQPTIKPLSATRDFWNEWINNQPDNDAICTAIESLRGQSRVKS